ncbi:hypothetical protein LOAG_07063 [Loa loa]|uniref:Uncharacterized protein n=1 Tax=Loa loa TaxID=7209 RepID=A0A1S0TYA4_LOALO|nr:hypothetical protein LOAG_07063 [Loa loa]EFO21425.1 hypothetical protein LOAG_07063 [Loa loa]
MTHYFRRNNSVTRRSSSNQSIEQISNTLERERISSSDTYRINSREKTSTLISRQSSRTRKGK